jgi:uncharacterized protein with HEPN domain
MRSEAAYLRDIVEACNLISQYIAGATVDSFETSLLVQDAVLYRLAVIGEAVKFITAETASKMPEIPWSKVKRMRNVLMHDYFGVNIEIAWDTAAYRVPELLGAIRRVFPEFK